MGEEKTTYKYKSVQASEHLSIMGEPFRESMSKSKWEGQVRGR